MALITFDPLQQTIELLLSKGWEQSTGQEDNKFTKGNRNIVITADHSTKDTIIELTLYREQSILLVTNHTTDNPMIKDFIFN